MNLKPRNYYGNRKFFAPYKNTHTHTPNQKHSTACHNVKLGKCVSMYIMRCGFAFKLTAHKTTRLLFAFTHTHICDDGGYYILTLSDVSAANLKQWKRDEVSNVRWRVNKYNVKWAFSQSCVNCASIFFINKFNVSEQKLIFKI